MRASHNARRDTVVSLLNKVSTTPLRRMGE
jgi:hypothetical protein